MRSRLAVSLALILGFIATPVAADGGSVLAALVASATGIPRTYDATLANMAAIRTAEANFDHRSLTELTSTGWSYAEVIGWNRFAADPYAYVINGWMTSPEHEPLLRDPFYQRIGCDHRSGVLRPTDGALMDYFVCIVGTPSGIIGPPLVETIPDTAMDPIR